jgi:hypothetical protein
MSCPANSSSTTTSSETVSCGDHDADHLASQLHAAMSFCTRERVAGQLLETALSSSESDNEEDSDEEEEGEED